jgi:BirA family biotin operon repressor/biotin-[acetyl-CoA-carboxylase] ligase
MNEREIRKILSALPLNGLRFFAQVGSTNDAALAWAAEGAQDLSLVCAEEQTSGRGRGSRRWLTPPGVSLAFSLVLRPRPEEESCLQLFSALGALAVCEAVEALGLSPEIKWPNDVLLHGRKFCGVLADAVWLQEKAESVVLGIGVNVVPGSIPPPERVSFPATCLEDEAGKQVDRLLLLSEILHAILYWRGQFSSVQFLRTWERHLAFRGQQVEVRPEAGKARIGRIEGLERDGSLRLSSPNGTLFTVRYGEVHLRPVV